LWSLQSKTKIQCSLKYPSDRINRSIEEERRVRVAHRPELEAFHHRKLVFERRPGGSRLVGDSVLLPPPTGLFSRVVAWLRRFPTATA
jgi:putative ATP-binding cassette transporter